MYSIEEIKKYDFFDTADMTFILDSLTGVVSRQYILGFAKYLIKTNTPFAMAMVDLDNFKSINDSYGHHIGDITLKNIAEGIQKVVGDDGLVGRFGGDEFIILYLKANDYDSVHDFYNNLYQDGPLRKAHIIDNNKIFVTGTVGSASFPIDSDNYDDLFMKMDKALYRGKTKGRNCYIIYVHEKHKDIVIKEREGKSLLEKFERINQIITLKSYDQVRTLLIDYLFRILHPYNAIYVDKNNYIQSGNTTKYYHYEKYDSYSILNKLLEKNDVLAISDPSGIVEKFPDTREYIEDNRIHAFVVVRVKDYGFIGIMENNISRMWQDSDLVLLYFAATELKNRLDKNK